MAFDMGDYKEVSERLTDLFAKHPFASLRGTYETLTFGDKTFIAYRAECYRDPVDPAPGVGTAWEEFPGRTPYTKGSELQNAETSAWGRAIVAVGASESKKIASANEVRSARSHQNAPPTVPTFQYRREQLKSRCVALQADGVSVADAREKSGLPVVDGCSEAELTIFETLVSDLEAELEKPFTEPRPGESPNAYRERQNA